MRKNWDNFNIKILSRMGPGYLNKNIELKRRNQAKIIKKSVFFGGDLNMAIRC